MSSSFEILNTSKITSSSSFIPVIQNYFSDYVFYVFTYHISNRHPQQVHMQNRTCFPTPSFHLFPISVNDTTHHSHSCSGCNPPWVIMISFLKFSLHPIQQFVWIHPLKCHEPDHSLAPSPLSLLSEQLSLSLDYCSVAGWVLWKAGFETEFNVQEYLLGGTLGGEYLWRGRVRMQDWAYGEIELQGWPSDSVIGPSGEFWNKNELSELSCFGPKWSGLYISTLGIVRSHWERYDIEWIGSLQLRWSLKILSAEGSLLIAQHCQLLEQGSSGWHINMSTTDHSRATRLHFFIYIWGAAPVAFQLGGKLEG